MNDELSFLIYNTPEENVSINAVIKDETIWLTQKAMAELFDCSTDNISLHLKNIYNDGELNESATIEEFSVVQKKVKKVNELDEDSVIRKFRITATDGKENRAKLLDNNKCTFFSS